MHKFEKLNNLSINIFEINFHLDNNKWKRKLIPIELSKNKTDKAIDLIIYKNHFALIKKLIMFIGKEDNKNICRKSLNGYTSDNMIIKHKQKCDMTYDITTIKTSSKTYLNWDKHCHKNPVYFGIYADFEADNGIEDTCIGNKTTNNYKQNPVCNGYRIQSEVIDTLKSEYYNFPLDNKNVDWFINEIMKIENKMGFYFKNTNKDIIMTEENKENFENNNVCRYCEKEILTDKVGDHCHLTGTCRGPAHNIWNSNVKQKDSNFIPVILHIFSKYDSHLFIERLVDMKNDKIDFKTLPQTNEEYISIRYGCIKFMDSYRFLLSSLGKLINTLVDKSHKTFRNLKKEIVDNDYILNFVTDIWEYDRTIEDLKKDYPDKIKNLEGALLDYMGENDLKILQDEFGDKWIFLTKKLVHPYEFFDSINDYQKPVTDLRKEDFFSKLKHKCPKDEEIAKTMKIN